MVLAGQAALQRGGVGTTELPARSMGGQSVAIAPGQFERVAEVVVERTADLLAAPVSVLDDRGVVVASSDPTMIGRLFAVPAADDFLGVPLQLAHQAGTVVIGRQIGGEAVSPRLATSLVELVIDQTAVVDRLPNKHELKNKLIHDLLRGSIDNDSAVLREAQILGMDLSPPRVVILIDAADYILAPVGDQHPPSETRIWQRAQRIINIVVDFFHLPNDTICAYIGEGEVAVLKASNKRNLGAWVTDDDEIPQSNPSWAHLGALKRASRALLTQLRGCTDATVSVGVGRHHPGISGFPRSYQDARAALSLGRRFQGPNQVHCLDSLGIAAFIGVADERTKIDLATYLLTPLDHEPELLATVSAFFAEDCSPSLTARALAIHRNTLSYRLDKITSLTGLDPRHFDEAVQIRLALLLRSMRQEPPMLAT
jgi:carbohydrate diacid regulator